MNKVERFPLNLQFFAEGDSEPQPNEGQQNEPTPEQETQDEKPDEGVKEPTVQELMVELAKVRRQLDKTSSEAAGYKKKWKETLSEQEQASMEKAEAQAAKDARLEELERKDRVHDLTENFMDLGYEKSLAKKAAEAQVDGDSETLLEIQKQFNDSQKKIWEAEFYKNMPQINSGTGNGEAITKEKFDSMSLVEKSKLRRENKAEYDRLIAL